MSWLAIVLFFSLTSYCFYLQQEQFSTEDHILQQAFIQHLLKKLRRPEKKPEKMEEWVEEIYAVLSVMPWSSSEIRGQFEALCEALWAARDGPLKEERVLSSLLRPQCDTLVSMYCSTAVRLQRDHLLRNTPDTQGNLTTYLPDHLLKTTVLM